MLISNKFKYHEYYKFTIMETCVIYYTYFYKNLYFNFIRRVLRCSMYGDKI